MLPWMAIAPDMPGSTGAIMRHSWADSTQLSGVHGSHVQCMWQSIYPCNGSQLLLACAVQGVMCRDTVSVGWDGAMYDCDFNQQLALGIGGRNAPKTVFDISSLQELQVVKASGVQVDK